MSSRDLGVAQVDAGVEHRGHEGVPEHVRMHPGDPHTGGLLQAVQAQSCRVPAHAAAVPVEQDRSDVTAADGPVGRSSHGWRHRDQDDLVPFADDAHDPVSVLLARGR